VGAAELLEDDDEAQGVESLAAVLLREDDAEEPELLRPVHQGPRELLADVELLGARGDLFVAPLAHALLQLQMLRLEPEIHWLILTFLPRPPRGGVRRPKVH